MKILRNAVTTIAAGLIAAFLITPAFAQKEMAKESSGAPDMNDPAMMAKMMELAKTGENHKLLGELAGTWSYTVKMWMGDPSASPMESKGTAVRKPIMDGRYYIMDATGKMEMPGADGKPQEMTFLGKSVEGYDNVKQKFVSTWMDNMGTGIMMAEGSYDPATKTFTYNSEVEMMPGMVTKVRETLKIVDKDHHLFEWFENRDGKDVKTMEINYTRQK
ncbi:MAG: DUF1579 domain-containing protein [Chthoniobacterales bacterium]